MRLYKSPNKGGLLMVPQKSDLACPKKRKIAGRAVALIYAIAVVIVHLLVAKEVIPPAASQLLAWFILLTPPFFDRKVTYSLIVIFYSITMYGVTMAQLPPVTQMNAYVSLTITSMMAALVSEFLFRSIEIHKKRNHDLELARESAEQSSHAKGIFIANMSHEIRTPISGIVGMTDLLLEESMTIEQRNHLSMIRDSSHRLMEVIGNILDYSNIDEKHLAIHIKEFDLEDVFAAAGSSFQRAIEKKGLYLRFQRDRDCPKILMGDPHRVKQILHYLISNAIKFTSEGGVEVQVALDSVVKGEVKLLFKVIDTGIGISKDIEEKLFSPFEQGDSSHSKRYAGLGLGLSITKSIVDALGGKIRVGEECSSGAEICFSLPFKSAASSQATFEKEPIHQPQNVNLLIAEDNPVNQTFLKNIMGKKGYRFRIVENGQEAVNQFKKGSYSAILMDIQMPVMSGIEATEAIRTYEKEHSVKAIPIVALTASVTESDRAEILSTGVDYFCPKPVNTVELFRTIETAVAV